MIYHFKLIMDGIQRPVGGASTTWSRAATASSASTSSATAPTSRTGHCRPPCFPIFSTFPSLINGGSISDAIVSLGGLNIIAGELER